VATKTKNLRLDLPIKYHRALRKIAGETGNKKGVVTEMVMIALVRGGYVKPSKEELSACGME
jgi:hypothetical protein